MHAQKKPHFGPVDFEEIPIYNQERAVVEQMTACSLIGSPAFELSKHLPLMPKAVVNFVAR